MFDLPKNDGERREVHAIGVFVSPPTAGSWSIEPSNYVFETLREDEEFVFCRGRSDDDEPPTILAITPVSEHPVPGILERLEHEYSLRAELDSDWAARPLTLVRREGRPMLILEDRGGEPLDRLLGQPMELSRFLRLAVGLAAALGKLHQQGLIHKDIKPANILVNSATGVIRLTGFGIASRLPRERQSPEPPEVIAGTLAYMAPEQTGRMNRSIDSRSDLYSLGVTCYELLTGALPFTASDPMEWVHCHIARQPVRPDEQVAGIPGPLSAIVMKLLAKTAEERYQTAAGVEAAFRRCLATWESFGRIDPFPLGTSDASDRLMIPEQLYGREREIDELLASFDRVVANGTPELVLVSGYSGIGKSSVVNELHKVLVPSRGLFASGKFDQYKRDIPYATLGQAFQSLVRPLLGQSEAELGRWREALGEALGANGQLIVNLVPALELVIGKQPPVPDLAPQDAQNRFQLVFQRFLGVFARKEHPLALFLDDLQWVDTATLDLLEHLVTHSKVRHLLLVGAYRDNEVDPVHPLLRALEAIRQAGAWVYEIVLAPLGLHDVGRLVADALHCVPEHARPLADLLQEKTGGNPFFAIQFFTALAKEGLLALDPVAPAWQWDINRIRAGNYTDNVVDLVAGNLRRFSADTQEALKQFACLGNVAEIATLTLVHGKTEEAVHAVLWEAVHAGLVFRLENAYKFMHDRIQQAAYSLIPEAHRAEVHLRIGRVLLASMTADELAEHLFDIANQFNRGAARLLDRDEKVQAATIDLRAGRKAKASAAFASACVHLAAGMALLDERDWGSRYELMFNLWLERAECEFLSGSFDKAEQFIEELLQRGASKVDQAGAYHLKVLLHTVKSENPQAVANALTCLRLFGIEVPAHPTREQVGAEYETIWHNLEGRPIENLIDLPPMTDPELQAAMQVLSTLLGPAYFTDFHLFCLLVCRMVNVSMQHGMCGASAHGCAYLGTVLGPVFHRYSEGYRFAKLACDLVEKHGFIAYQAKAYHSMGIVAIWTQPIATAIEFNRAAFRTAIETGDLTTACYSVDQSVTSFLVRNDPLDAVWRESEKSLEFVRKARFHDVAAAIVSQQRYIATMQGRTATFSTFSDAQFDEAAFEEQLTGDRTPTMVCLYWIVKLKTRFLSGDYAEALAAAEKARALLWASPAHIQLLDYFYYTALTVAALSGNATPEEQNRWRKLLTAHCEQLREWAENYPPTFAEKHALVGAEIARLENRDLDAMRLYEKAIRAARENGFVQNEGLANELAAQFYLKRGIERVGHSYLRESRYCYLRWGALGKVQQLDERYPAIAEQASLRPATRIGTSVEQLDLGTVMKASQAVAGEIELEKLIKTLMMIAVEHAGAERGLLILSHGTELRVAAEARTGRDGVEVQLQHALVTPSDLPDSLFRYVIRTLESVILDDASVQNQFSEDEYVRQQRPRSTLCLPLVKQAKLMGVLYLENKLVPRVFTPNRLAMLELLASQAAISLDHARLYADLGRLNAELKQENSDRKKAEEALRASEERWRKLFENSSAGIALITPDGHYIAANLALQKMLGYSQEELQRLSALELTHEEDRAATEAILSESVDQRRLDFRIEKRYRRKDGNVIWADLSSTLVPATGSSPAFFATVVVDVSERKRAEEELRESEQRLQDIVDNTTAVVFVKDLDLRYLLVNREYERRHRVRRDQIHGKTDFDILPRDVAEAVRDNDRQVIEAGVPIQFEETVPSDAGEHLYVSVKFLLRDRTGKPYALCSIATDISDLKRADEMRAAMARERELFAQQRATELAKANEVLRGCLDALASVPELDDFLGQVMAAITRQLGAVSSLLRVRNFEQNTLAVELIFQNSRVLTPDEAKFPETWRSLSLVKQRAATFLDQPTAVVRILDPHSALPEELRFYLLGLGVKTLLIIPLTLGGQANGQLSFRFTEERDFDPEELEIARALAIPASLAIHLTRLAKSARQSAVLEERNQLAAEIHDALAQSFTGISMQLGVAGEQLAAREGDPLRQIQRANEIAKFGLAEARRSILSLRSGAIQESGLTTTLQRLVEHSNVAGRLRCEFRSDSIPEERLSPRIQHELLRFAQEAISNAVRHAKPTVVSVTLRWEPPNLILKVKDNGSGISGATRKKSEGFGLSNMRTRASQIDGKLDIDTAAGHGTSIVLTVPIPS
jgi:PAS domain S-box-containing protein